MSHLFDTEKTRARNLFIYSSNGLVRVVIVVHTSPSSDGD